MLTWEMPYTYLLILFISPFWYQTIWFSLLCSLFTSLVMWVVYRWRLRKFERATRIRFEERLAQQARIARELYDTLLQTVQGSKLVADDALENSNDTAYMRLAMEKLSGWLGQATRDGQEALRSLSTANVGNHDD